jgi:hypothetical protein
VYIDIAYVTVQTCIVVYKLLMLKVLRYAPAVQTHVLCTANEHRYQTCQKKAFVSQAFLTAARSTVHLF